MPLSGKALIDGTDALLNAGDCVSAQLIQSNGEFGGTDKSRTDDDASNHDGSEAQDRMEFPSAPMNGSSGFNDI